MEAALLSNLCPSNVLKRLFNMLITVWMALLMSSANALKCSINGSGYCRPNTHTRTRTHVCFCEKWGHPIGIIVFILYKLCAIALHLNLALTGNCISTLPQKTHSVWFISVLKSGDMGQCPHKSPSPCNTYVIPMSLYKFMSSCHKNAQMHTHIHTHARRDTTA